ncbi:MAG: T9SS type A sorting domain-containing protein [Bacteroidota bacterium]|nr:T9SS type A sorting domain-containing protein [Bacteroidota bacterium]
MKKLILLFALSIFINPIYSQCTTGVSIGTLTPTNTFQTIAVAAGVPAYRTFNATAGTQYLFTYCQGGGTYSGDPYLTVATNAPTSLAQNDDWCGLGSEITWTAPSTGVHRLYFSGCCPCSNAPNATLAYRLVGPANDPCSGAFAIAMPSTTLGSTTNATPDVTPFGGSSNGVWYSVVGNGNQFTLTTCGGTTNYDTYLAVYTGTCASLVGVAVNDDACGASSSVTFCTTVGVTYSIHVYGFASNSGNFTLNATETVIPTPSVSPSSAAICSGGASATITASGSTSYSWAPAAGLNTTSGATVIASPTTTTTYTVTGETNGCTNTATVTVTVNPLPTVTATASSNTVCNGDMVTLMGGGATSYTWDNGAVDNVAFAATATTTYMVTGTDANGCVNTASTTVTVNPLPTVTATASDNVVCNGDMVTLMGGGAATYTWTGGVTDATPFAATATTTYTVTGTDLNGCMSTATTTVTVNALPVVTLTAFAMDTVCFQTPGFTLTGGSPAGGVYSGAGVITGLFNPSSAGVGVFPITYTVTDANSCTSSAMQNITVEDCTGIEESISSAEINVYPNPNNGSFSIAINNASFTEVVISIVDLQGKEVFTSIENNVSGSFTKEISLVNIAKGMYYIKLSTANDLTIKKLMVH